MLDPQPKRARTYYFDFFFVIFSRLISHLQKLRYHFLDNYLIRGPREANKLLFALHLRLKERNVIIILEFVIRLGTFPFFASFSPVSLS